MKLRRLLRGVRLFRTTLFVCLAVAAVPGFGEPPEHPRPDPLINLSLEDLMNIEVISASRKEEPVFDAAAAVFVITEEDIRNSGYLTLPEIFRLVPGMQVARIGGSEWAISARGFNGYLSEKLLVLIDGRSVYTPGYAGVNWNAQNIPLENIERVEVIRGPGGTMWGANAVNGVINIVTKKAVSTPGLFASAWHGPLEKGDGVVRYGGRLADSAFFRVFFKQARRGDDLERGGRGEGNAARSRHGGFRLDWEPSPRHGFTLQGDLYRFEGETVATEVDPFPPFLNTGPDRFRDHGFNLLGRWSGKTSGGGEFQAQAYFDHYDHDYAILQEKVKTFDVDVQYRLAPTGRHDLVLGAGFRRIDDSFQNTFQARMIPEAETSEIWSAFLQDQATWNEGRSRLIAGAKFEHNPFTGVEFQPSLRFAQRWGSSVQIWGAISRAVRTPSKLLRGIRVLAVLDQEPLGPVLIEARGVPDIESEVLVAAEAGFRWRYSDRFIFDAACFYNDYDKVSGVQPGLPRVDPRFLPPQLLFPLLGQTHGRALIRGFELTAEWRPWPRWRLIGSISRLDFAAEIPDREGALFMPSNPADNPDWQYSLRSSARLGPSLQFDLLLRKVGKLAAPLQTISSRDSIEGYTEADARLGLRLSPRFELSLAGQNLLHPSHQEFADSLNIIATRYRIPRSLHLKAAFQF